MQRAYAKVKGEMPGVKNVSVSPSTSSLLTRFMMPRGANAVTNPFSGNITYNPAMLDQQGYSQTDLENILAHEMTHVQQTQDMPWYKKIAQIFGPDEKVPQGYSGVMDTPYYWRPMEQEAYQAERNRDMATHRPNPIDPINGSRDIVLPPSPAVINKVRR